jgi:hypothetical protein
MTRDAAAPRAAGESLVQARARAELRGAVLSRLDEVVDRARSAPSLDAALEAVEEMRVLVRQGLQEPSERRLETTRARLEAEARRSASDPGPPAASADDEDAPRPDLAPPPGLQRRRRRRLLPSPG